MAPFTNVKSLRGFLDVLPIGTAIIGVRGTIVGWDKQSEKLFGISEKDAIGMSVFSLFPSSQFTLEKYLSVTPHIKRRARKKIFQRHNGKKEQHIEITFSNLEQHLGDLGVIAVFRDVTHEFEIEVERKKAEDLLQKSEERFRALFELAPDVIYSISGNGQFTELNEVFEKITGFKRADWIGKSYKELTHPDDVPFAQKKFEEGIKGNTSEAYELRIKTSLGKYITAEFRSKPRNIDGKVDGKLGIFRDITERKREEKQQNYMLGIASHELRTPLASMKVSTQIMKKKFANTKNEIYLTYVEKIENQINKLTKLISDLLDIERIKAGKLEVIYEIFYFDKLAKEIVDELQSNYQHKFIIKGQTGRYIKADRGRIGRILTNLLTNAVKYSPGKKKVIITLSSNIKSVTVCIRDFGIGIPKTNLEKIFEPFYQANTDDKKKIPSIGLGLYISSELAGVHNGKIWVESESGQGSSFYLNLPIKPQLAKKIQKPSL